jgi:hypothetical protein
VSSVLAKAVKQEKLSKQSFFSYYHSSIWLEKISQD